MQRRFLLILRWYPENSLTNGGNKSVIHDGTSLRLFELVNTDLAKCK